MPPRRRNALNYLTLLGISIYRNTLSSIMLHGCRYLPTCSEYARQAVKRHGALRGAWVAAMRVLRCHPLASGGYDPVPPPAGQGRSMEVTTASALMACPPAFAHGKSAASAAGSTRRRTPQVVG